MNSSLRRFSKTYTSKLKVMFGDKRVITINVKSKTRMFTITLLFRFTAEMTVSILSQQNKTYMFLNKLVSITNYILPKCPFKMVVLLYFLLKVKIRVLQTETA